MCDAPAAIYTKVKQIEGRLKGIQKVLEKIDQKLDISFYANFRAALDLAQNAFLMDDPNNRKSSALQAINRFLEAEHTYTDLLIAELEYGGEFCADYLLTLYLAYLAEVRCYLELRENNTALRRFQEGKSQTRELVEKCIDLLLTKHPAIYLHPKFHGLIDLSRLTKIYQWKDSSFDENKVFEKFRSQYKVNSDDGNFFTFNFDWDNCVGSLPQAVIASRNIDRGFWGGISDEGKKTILERLPQVISEIESQIETHSRFAAYEHELALINKAKIPLSKWENLKPKESIPEDVSLIYLVPPTPLRI